MSGAGAAVAAPRSRGAFLLLWCVTAVDAAGDVKLWELGRDVEKRPKTIFFLFILVMFLTLLIEGLKHKAEHATKGTKRGQALNAIFSELMMIGIVSFLLILAAELGFTDIKITASCDTEAVSDSGNKTGAETCHFGFDVLLFEYAHLVLFFMGIVYGVFIQVAFGYRKRSVRKITKFQQRPLSSAAGVSGKFVLPSLVSIMGLWSDEGFRRTVLILRNAMVIHLEDELRGVCHPVELRLERAFAVVKGQPAPHTRAKPDDAMHSFCMARFVHVAIADTLIGLLHISPVVWLGIVGLAGLNLLYLLGLSLAQVLFCLSLLPIVSSLFLLARMARQLRAVVLGAVGHPLIDRHNHNSVAGAFELRVPNRYADAGREWSVGGPHPWETLTGCCSSDSYADAIDPNDSAALATQIQLSVFCSCFYIGEITMLSLLIAEDLGVHMLLILYVLATLPLVWFVPRMILLYTLIHKTCTPERDWLIYALTHKVESGGAHGSAATCSPSSDDEDPLEELRCALNQRHRALNGSHSRVSVASLGQLHQLHGGDPLGNSVASLHSAGSPHSAAHSTYSSMRGGPRGRTATGVHVNVAASIAGAESTYDGASDAGSNMPTGDATLPPTPTGGFTPKGRRRHPLRRSYMAVNPDSDAGSFSQADGVDTPASTSSPQLPRSNQTAPPRRHPAPRRRPTIVPVADEAGGTPRSVSPPPCTTPAEFQVYQTSTI